METQYIRLIDKNDDVSGRTIMDILNQMWNFTDEDNGIAINKFLEDYEVFHIKDKLQLCFIIRGIKMRLKKYYYLPPAYIVFDLTQLVKGKKTLMPQHLRFYQKLEPISTLVAENKKNPGRAYFLSENPFQTLYHPHIDSVGCACYGRWIEELEMSPSMYAFMEVIRAFLHDYNYRSTFFSVNPYDWDVVNRYMAGPYLFEKPHYLRQMGNLIDSKDVIHDFCEENETYNGKEHFIKELMTYDSTDPNNYSPWNVFYSRKMVEYGLVDNMNSLLASGYHDYMVGEQDVDFNETFWELERQFNLNRLGRVIANWWIEKRFSVHFLRGDMKGLQHGIRSWQFVNKLGDKDTEQRYSELNKFVEKWTNFSQEIAWYIILATGGKDLTGFLATVSRFMIASHKQYAAASYNELHRKVNDLLEVDVRMESLDPFRTDWFENNVYLERSNINVGGWECRFRDIDWHYVAVRGIMTRLYRTIDERRQNSGRAPFTFSDAEYIVSEYINGSIEKSIKLLKPLNLTIGDVYIECLTQMWNTNNLVGETVNNMILNQSGYSLRNLPRDVKMQQLPFDYDTTLDFIRGVVPDFPDDMEDLEPYMERKLQNIVITSLQKYVEVCNHRKKEIKNVLKNTLPSMEQGKLLSQQVPQS